MKERSDMLKDTRFIASDSDRRLHDLANEKEQCHIDNIIETSIVETFADPDQAYTLGYARCSYCFEEPDMPQKVSESRQPTMKSRQP